MKYRLTEKIGIGGMAEVFRAIGEGPEGFERAFVIKRIHPRLSEAPEFVRMFVDEAKISARLIHPNIVQVFEFAYQAGGYYIVMEPVDGVDMGRLLRRLEQRREVPPPAFVAEVGRQACRGLDFAHTLTSADGRPLGIVHRDVTPPNIMVAWNGTVKIVDFGIARAVQEIRTNMTEAGMVKGKMSYVAPELLEGKTADARSDVFSLGVVLHGLLSGRQLFQGENDLETLKMVQEMVIPPPSARNPGVKRPLDSIVMRALERNPDKRYRNAGEMGDELEALVLRERYGTRALGRKARELVPEDEMATTETVVGSSADLIESEEPTSLGQRDAVIVFDELANRPVTRPPPLNREVAVTEALRKREGGAWVPRYGAEPPAAVGARRADRLRWAWLAIGVPSVLAAALLGVVRWPSAGRGAANLAAAPASSEPFPTAQVSLDSIPQGATVTTTATARGASGATAGGATASGATTSGATTSGATIGGESGKRERLGETPVLLKLVRGPQPVEFVLTKPGFAPLTFRIIPHQDKDVVARLERLPPPPAPVAELPVATTRHGSHHSSSSSSTGSPKVARATTPVAATASPHPPVPPVSVRR